MTQADDKIISKDYESYDDMKEFFAKFIFSPEFEGYEHITKDLSITNLRSSFKEPESCRELLKAFHVLTNSVYFEPVTKKKLLGFDKETKEAVYSEIKALESKFPRTFHSLRSKWVAIISTSLSRDGHLMRSFKTTKFVKEESIEDKTDAPKKFFYPRKRNN